MVGMIRKLDKHESELLVRWRLRANELAPFMGHLLFSLRFLSVDSSIVTTAAGMIESFTVVINFEGLSDIGMDLDDPDDGAFVLLHEAQHFLLNHHSRFQLIEHAPNQGKATIWNTAGDFEINVILQEIMHRKYEQFVYPDKYEFENRAGAEIYYRRLLEDQLASSSGGEGEQGSGSGEGDEQDEGIPGCGTASGESVDGHIARKITEYAESQYGRFSEQEVTDIIKESLSNGKQAGSLPGNTVDSILDSMTPKVNWKQALRNSVIAAGGRALGRELRDYRRPNRRIRVHTSKGKIFIPGHKSVKLNVAVVRDTSGSMDAGLLAQANAEIEGIIRDIGNARVKLTVFDCDAQVHQAQQVSQGTLSRLNDVRGRGGTNMMVGIEYALDRRKTNQAADVIIVVTDGYSPWSPKFISRTPIIVCLIPDSPDVPVSDFVRDNVPSWVRKVVEVRGL